VDCKAFVLSGGKLRVYAEKKRMFGEPISVMRAFLDETWMGSINGLLARVGALKY
jgi:hypothetical protein